VSPPSAPLAIAENFQRKCVAIALRLERDRRVQSTKLAAVARELEAVFRAMQHHDVGVKSRMQAYERFADLKSAAENLLGEVFR